MFMNAQFGYVGHYQLLDGGLLEQMGRDDRGWKVWKESFVKLLIETGRDFSLRSVAQVDGVGPPKIRDWEAIDEEERRAGLHGLGAVKALEKADRAAARRQQAEPQLSCWRPAPPSLTTWFD